MMRALAIALLATGCAAGDKMMSDQGAANGAWDTGLGDGGDEADSLRLDVYPSSTRADLRAQTYLPADYESWDDLRVALQPTVAIHGTIVGFDANPHFDVTVPGEDDVPVIATLAVSQSGTINQASVASDESGDYTLEIPAGDDYRLSVVPSDPALLPFVVQDQMSLQHDTPLNFQLDYGIPVYGTITDGADLPSSTRATLVDAASGVEGPPASIEDDGSFLLRALPGSYMLLVQANDSSYLPTVSQPVTVEDANGTRIDVDLGVVDPVQVSGSVVDAGGKAVVGARVRFTATQLSDAEGTSIVITETDRHGQFSRLLLPGEWSIEAIPPYEADGVLSPTELAFTLTDDLDLNQVELPTRIDLSSVVEGPDSALMAGVIVTATEQGFDGYQYSGVTDEDGRFDISVPDVPLLLTLAPGDSDHAITHYDLKHPASPPDGFVLSTGRIVKGLVASGEKPVPYALIELRDADGDLYGSTLTDEDGGFAVRVATAPQR